MSAARVLETPYCCGSIQHLTTTPPCCSAKPRKSELAARAALRGVKLPSVVVFSRGSAACRRSEAHVWRPVSANAEAASFDFGGTIWQTIIAAQVVSVVYFAPIVLMKKMNGEEEKEESILKLANSPKGWREIFEVLNDAGVESMSGEEASGLLKSPNVVLIDVRPAAEFVTEPSEGAINIPFLSSDGRPTEDPEFVTKVTAVVEDKARIIVVDGSFVGTLKRTPSVQYGKPCQALIAAYLLAKVGKKNMVHVQGGVEGLVA